MVPATLGISALAAYLVYLLFFGLKSGVVSTLKEKGFDFWELNDAEQKLSTSHGSCI